MRPIYTPIFDGFFEGSIMGEEVETRFLFLVVLRLALRPGSDGSVDIPLSRLAALAAMSEDAVRRALDALMRPDPLSGSKDEEGRRLVRLNADQPDRGWRVVNAEKYRRAVHDANAAARMRRLREERAKGADVPDVPKRSQTFLRNDTKRNEKRGRGSPRGARAPLTPRLPEILAFARENRISERSATAYFQHRSEKGWRGVADFRPGLTKWAAEDAEREAPVKPSRPRVASLADLDPKGAG